jgi:cytochrome c oxidase subunit III
MVPGKVKHDYHLVEPSPWPFIGALAFFVMLLGAVLWLNAGSDFLAMPPFIRPLIFSGGAILAAFTAVGWWRDVIAESVRFGEHKPVVILSFRFAMALFLVAEAVFFVALFWAYFDMALFRSAGAGWPPPGVTPADPWRLPLLATLVLLLSGSALAWAARAVRAADRKGAVRGLALAVLLGAAFAALLFCNLSAMPFHYGLGGLKLTAVADLFARGNPGAIYGSVFFAVAGALLLHVVAGVAFLAVCLGRAAAGHFVPQRHFGFEAASWFWQFGLVVWLLVYGGIYVLDAAFAVR